MEEKIYLILKIFTYFSLFPLVLKTLMAVDFSKITKKNYIGEIRILYIMIAIIITKMVSDFFFDIMKMIVNLFGINI